MKTLTHKKQNNLLMVVLFTLSFFSLSLQAQVIRPYSLAYTNNLRGGHTLFGNTSLILKMQMGLFKLLR